MDTCGLALSLLALFKAGHAISDTFEISRAASYTSSTLHSRPSCTLFPSLPTLPFNSYRKAAGLAHVSDCIRLIIGKQIANTYSADTHTHTHTGILATSTIPTKPFDYCQIHYLPGKPAYSLTFQLYQA